METNEVLNRKELFARVDDDVELLGELIELFMEDYPDLIAGIQSAIATQDATALKKAAHTLKGAIGNFCAPKAFEATRKMEMNGVTGDFSTSQLDFQNLLQEMENATAALKKLSEEFSD